MASSSSRPSTAQASVQQFQSAVTPVLEDAIAAAIQSGDPNPLAFLGNYLLQHSDVPTPPTPQPTGVPARHAGAPQMTPTDARIAGAPQMTGAVAEVAQEEAALLKRHSTIQRASQKHLAVGQDSVHDARIVSRSVHVASTSLTCGR